MVGLSEFPKFTKSDIFCTSEVKFADVDIGNFFMIGEDVYMRMNYPGKRLYARNAVIISSSDPGLCGMGIYVDSQEEVEVVTETRIGLRGETKF
jgi:hypothetical protein